MLSKTKFREIVAKNIKRERLKKGLTQDELSFKCGFYRTNINLLETEKRSPSSFSLYKIAKALQIQVDKLYPETV